MHSVWYMPHFQESYKPLIVSWVESMPLNKSKVTILDIFGTTFEDEDGFKKYILNNYWINIWTKSGITYFNIVLKEAISFYEKILGRTYPRTLPKYFNTSAEIFNFISKTKVSSPTSQVRCSILKICSSVHDVISNPVLNDLDQKMERLLYDKFHHWIFWEDNNFPSASEFSKGIYVKPIKNKKWEIIWNRSIPFSIYFRHKEKDKTMLKVLYNPNYSSSQEMKDIFWIRIEVATPEDALFIAELVYERLWHWQIESSNSWWIDDSTMFYMKDKWLLTPESIKFAKNKIDIPLWEEIQGINMWNRSKQITAWKYRDFKFMWDVLLSENNNIHWKLERHWVEVQIVLVWNDNETKFAHHSLFDAKKIISAMVRLQWYVSQAYVMWLIDTTLKDNPEIKLSKEKIFDHFLESFLIKLAYPWSKTIYFITSERFDFLTKSGINWDWIKLFDYSTQSWIKNS